MTASYNISFSIVQERSGSGTSLSLENLFIVSFTVISSTVSTPSCTGTLYVSSGIFQALCLRTGHNFLAATQILPPDSDTASPGSHFRTKGRCTSDQSVPTSSSGARSTVPLWFIDLVLDENLLSKDPFTSNLPGAFSPIRSGVGGTTVSNWRTVYFPK